MTASTAASAASSSGVSAGPSGRQPRPRLSLLLLAAAAASHASVASAQPYFPAGITLDLQTCGDPTPSALQLFNRNPDGSIVHAASGLCVEAVEPSDYGWRGMLRLLPCSSSLLQRFTVDAAAGTLVANASLANTCLTFNIFSGNRQPGGTVQAYWCSTPPSSNDLFLLDTPFANAIQARGKDGKTGSNLCVSVAQPSTAYTLDDTVAGAVGSPWEGLGAVAGEGTARLVFDFPEPQRSQVLDALFLPGTGAGLSLLKIEIGGDGMGTMGSESAHQHYQGETSQAATRGTQVWFAQQAKQRNPNLKLYALPWSWPGWLGSSPGASTPLDNPTQAAQYVVDWLTAVQTYAGLTMDYVGLWSDNWDPVLTPPYAKALRAAMNSAGFASTQLVCADSNDFECAAAALKDPALLAVVDIFGDHQGPSKDAHATGKRIWRSWANFGGTPNLQHAPQLAYQINDVYIGGNVTGMLVFSAVGASYNTLPEWNFGPVLADRPWSGWYKLTPGWYALAHTCQFAKPGWNYLSQKLGSDVLTRGGNFVTRVDTRSGTWAWSTVIVKSVGGSETNVLVEMATFNLRGNIAAATPASVYVTTTCFGATGMNVSFLQGPVAVPVTNNAFSLFLLDNCVYTVTNQASGVGPYIPTMPAFSAPAPFPSSYSDDFAGSAPGNPGRYWSDINGAFEVVDDPSVGRGLQQKAAMQPITRRMTDTRPHTVLGEASWEDVDFSATFSMPTAADSPGFCVRCNCFNDTSGVDGSTGADHMPGVWVHLTTTTWTLSYTLETTVAPVRSGTLTDTINPNEKHTVRLLARGGAVVVFLDGYILLRQNLTVAANGALPPARGFVGLGSARFGLYPVFTSVSVEVLATACTDVPVEGAMPHEEPCAAGSPAQALVFTPAPGNPAAGPGSFALAANTSLCLRQNRTADPQYRNARTRAVTLQPCDPADPQQLFLIEQAGTEGGVAVGPVSGTEGYAMDVYGNSEKDDSDIAAYPFEGGTNQWWTWDAGTGTLFASFMQTCLSFCTKM